MGRTKSGNRNAQQNDNAKQERVSSELVKFGVGKQASKRIQD
ncbi:hypothetical protein [Bacillus sp. HMF5848]|nr:hypothetical protein [Bacillus sp. HMF5848]